MLDSGGSGIIRLILSQFQNRVRLKPMLEGWGRRQCCISTLLHMHKLNKTESAIFVSLMCSLLPKDLHSELILSSLMLCRVAAVKRLPVYHHSADYIFWSFGIIGLILSRFEDRVPLKPVLGDWAGVAQLHEQTP